MKYDYESVKQAVKTASPDLRAALSKIGGPGLLGIPTPIHLDGKIVDDHLWMITQIDSRDEGGVFIPFDAAAIAFSAAELAWHPQGYSPEADISVKTGLDGNLEYTAWFTTGLLGVDARLKKSSGTSAVEAAINLLKLVLGDLPSKDR